MTFQDAIRTCFQKYVTISGRARRSEYWWWVLFVIAGSLAASVLDGILFGFGEKAYFEAAEGTDVPPAVEF